VTTVPRDQMSPPEPPPRVNSSAPQTGKGQVNLGPPIIGIGTYVSDPVTGLGKSNVPPPAGLKPYKDTSK
jgi:hypothetical protein